MSKIRSIILAAFGVSIILFMVHLAGAGDVIEVVRQADHLILLAAVLVEFAAFFLWAVRWKILLKPFKSVSLANTYKGVLIGVFFNNITPVARAGGEPFRAYYMNKKEHIDFEDAFATVAIDRIMDSIPFQVFIIISLTYFLLFLKINIYMLVILFLIFIFNLILLSLVLYFSLNINAAKKLIFSIFRFVAKFSTRVRKYESQIEKAVEHYHGAIMKFSSQGGNLALSLSISFVFWFLVILRNYLVVMALGYDVSFLAIMMVQIVGTLVGILPLLPGGLGSVDGIFVFLYLSLQFPFAGAVSASLLDRFISFWIAAAVGGIVVVLEREFLKGKK